jgi:hypothetical protein
MNFFQYFVWLSGQALGSIWLALIVILPLFALVFAIQFYKHKKITFTWLPCFLFFFPALILILGTIFRYSSPDDQPWLKNPSKLPLILISCVFFVEFITSAFLVYRLKNFRWIALIWAIFFLVISFFAWFVAGMSVTGDWL